MHRDFVQFATGMSARQAEQLLADEPGCQEATSDQAILERAIFTHLGPLARGHTPGSVERAIRWVEPHHRSIVVHTSEGFDFQRIVFALVPQLEAGEFSGGVPALRSGPSNREVVLYRDGIDAAVILAGVDYHEWREVIDALQARTDTSCFIGGGGVLDVERAAIAENAQYLSGQGSPLLRSIGALLAVKHTAIDLYDKNPGIVVEVVQPDIDQPARERLRWALERNGLGFVRGRSRAGEYANFEFEWAGSAGPLIIRFVVRATKFPRQTSHEATDHLGRTSSRRFSN